MKQHSIFSPSSFQYVILVFLIILGFALSTLLLIYVSIAAYLAGCGLVTIFTSEHIYNFIYRHKPLLPSSKKPLAIQAIALGIPISVSLVILWGYHAL